MTWHARRLGCLAALLLICCGDDDGTTVLDGSSGESCERAADCQGGELCVERTCREACGEDDPCSGTLPACDVARGVCVRCIDDVECAGGQLCLDNDCVTICSDDGDCAGGQTCNSRTGRCVVLECEGDSDCAGGERCSEGSCEPIGTECDDDNPCSGSEECIGGECVAIPSDGGDPMDVGVEDAGEDATVDMDAMVSMDAGTDSGSADAGRDAGRDAGPMDAGFDSGGSCTGVSCGVTQRCCGGGCANLEVPRGSPGRDDSSFRHCGACGVQCNVDRASACSRPLTGGNMRCMCGDGVACAAGEVCVPGTTSGFVCTDLDDDPNNCGFVGHACPDGEDCISGECRCGVFPTCGGGQACCDDTCVDTTRSAEHCGGCGRSCSPRGNRCVGSECLCGSGDTCAVPQPFPATALGELCCGSGTGATCVAQGDSNCGSCGAICLPMTSCAPPLLGTEPCCSSNGLTCDGFPFP